MLGSTQMYVKVTGLYLIRYGAPFDQVWPRIVPSLLDSDVSAFAKSLVDDSYTKVVLPRIP